MMGRVGIYAGLFALLIALTVDSAVGNETAPCFGVVLVPSKGGQAVTQEAMSEINRLLFERAVAAAEAEGLNNGFAVSLDRDRFVFDAPGMTCEEATDLAESRIIRATTIEIGLAGAAPLFHAGDVEPNVDVFEEVVRIRLRRQATEVFRILTRDNIGGTVAVRINDGAEIELPIQTELRSGWIALDRSKVPEGSFLAETLLPFRLEVAGCVSCLGEYRQSQVPRQPAEPADAGTIQP